MEENIYMHATSLLHLELVTRDYDIVLQIVILVMH